MYRQDTVAWKLSLTPYPIVVPRGRQRDNTIVFIVDRAANKRQIEGALKKLYDVSAAKINTLIRPDGKKKAFVRLTPDQDALDVCNRIGFL